MNADIEDSSYTENVMSVFMNSFGDFSLLTSEMNTLDYLLLVSSTTLICLVMMNLFIGILSVKLEEIIESRAEDKNKYKELCGLIFEMELLIFWEKSETAD
jgi:hypothetical protein